MFLTTAGYDIEIWSSFKLYAAGITLSQMFAAFGGANQIHILFLRRDVNECLVLRECHSPC